MGVRESELLRHIAKRSPLKALGPGVVVGPGDDCAVLAPSGRDLLVTVDHLVEGRHFAAGTPIDAIARKAVARSVSDIAAMAGTPAWGLATGALPPEWMAGGQGGADELFDRMAHWARHWHCPLVGGDISSLPEGSPLVLTVTVAGHVHATRGAVLRSGACAGDAVWVTGRIGGSLSSGRHLTFEPRVAEGRWLADALGEDLHAMIDVSDGLGRDAGRIAAASAVRMEIERARVPLHGDAGATGGALADGEDYELVFTTAAGVDFPAACPLTGVSLTRIGRVVAGNGCGVVEADGRVVEGAELGWDH